MSDRVVILDGGKHQQFATSDRVYNRPDNRFVADFIGSPAMNFFEAKLDGSTLAGEDLAYEVPPSILEAIAEGYTKSGLELGVRPEDVTLDADSENAIPATVEVVEVAGSNNFVYVAVGGAECRVRVTSNVKPTVGDQVSLTFDPKDIHVFDIRTGENLLTNAKSDQPVSEEPVS